MGLDGFSVANLGLHTEKTSAQMASESKRLAKKGKEHSIKDIEEITEKKSAIDEEDLDEDNSDNEAFDLEGRAFRQQKGDKETAIDHLDETKQYAVKLNPITQMIELMDVENNSVIETITPNDLIKLVYKLNSASGILVNKKI